MPKGSKQKQVVPPLQSSCDLCDKPDNDLMVSCDLCDKWFHYECVGVDASVADRDWNCAACAGFQTQLPTEFSTPLGGATAQPDNVAADVHKKREEDLRKQLELLQQKLEQQQASYKEQLRRKDEERNQALRKQLDDLEYEQNLARKRTRKDDKVSGMQSNSRGTGAIPKANSTAITGLKRVDDIDQQLRTELKLLEERQALEKKHLEERYSLLRRARDRREEATVGQSSQPARQSDPVQISGSNATVSLSTWDHELSRSQLAARHAIRDLPPFSGNPEQWPLFYASYESSTRICGYTDEENMLRLQRSLQGEALDYVRSQLLFPANITNVMTALRSRFGRPEVIVRTLINKVNSLPAPKLEKPMTLVNFGGAVQNICATIQASGLDEYMCNVSLLYDLVEKLPATFQYNWASHQDTLQKVTLLEFAEWLKKLVDAAIIIGILLTSTTSKPEPKPDKRGTRRTEFVNVHSEATASSSESTYKSAVRPVVKGCVVCKQACASLESCKQFTSMDVNARWSVVKEYRLCRKCLRKHFGACQVRTACGKGGCTFMHNQLLHNDARYKPTVTATPSATAKETEEKDANSTTQTCNAHLNDSGDILFRYIPVTIYGRGCSIQTYAFLDDGSSSTFIEHSLMNELNLDGSACPLYLNWTAEQCRYEKDSMQVSLRISGINSKKVYEILTAHTVQSLALPLQSVSKPELASRYPHLEDIPIQSYSAVSPRILIGIDNCHLGHTLDSREGDTNQPTAVKTRLGWIVYGPCLEMKNSLEQQKNAFYGLHICTCNGEIECKMNAALKEYFSIESLGICKSSTPLLSKDNERAVHLLQAETHLKGNRYETGLLWRFDNATLPDSKPMAMKRLICLEKRMSRDPMLMETLRAKIQEYLEKGYLRKLTPDEVAAKHPRDWYLPVFPVVNPNKPGKVRIVFDAAALVGGVSLNSFLLSGPDQLASLLSVLYKFRQHKFAVVADIREMFHQVLIKEEDQYSQKILWRDGDSNREPDEYVMCVMTFGATCSPSSAQFAKNTNAERFQGQFPRAVECIKNEHYVDDMLASVELEDEAVNLAEDVRYIHAQGGFELRNWLSNSKKVLERVDEDWTAERSLKLGSEVSAEKVLGMWWNTETDNFTFKISSRLQGDLLSGLKIPTKRDVLSILMSIYDPLGLLAPFLMYLKILLQEIWREGTGWFDQISLKSLGKWRKWLEVLPSVEKVQIPRCYRQLTTLDENTIQLHTFVDASENGIAAVSYLRFDQNGVVECALVGAKTRVAPLKFMSIPRQELQAALIGARLAGKIVESHQMKIAKRFFWSDSKDTISWIRSDHRRYSQFVAFRVGEILETSEVTEWKWIPTKQNVADEGTKWQKLPDLSPNSRWYRGPEFLRKKEEHWPQFEDPGTTTEELRANVLHHSVRTSLIKFQNFSRWKPIVRAIAYANRLRPNILRHKEGKPSDSNPFSQDELLRAERIAHHEIQQEVFSAEIAILSTHCGTERKLKRLVPKSSPLFKLNPVIDEHGIIRMRGRIDNCAFASDSAKRPIILPKNHHATDLIVADYHQKFHHLNHETAMNEIRQKYHVPRLRSVYQRVRRQCQFCKIRDARPQPPMMADHSQARLAAFTRPFSYTGIDYFGPMQVVVGRRVEKRWGVLFTCLTMRGIHIEVAHSLSTDSCIMAIQNFQARRGKPLEYHSDQGTNFVGANSELQRELQKMDQHKVMEEFEGEDTKWVFNPPAAPHFGGCWERLVQSVKRNLNQIKPKRNPTDEILRNMMIEVEMIINSRPLTYVPINEETEPPLTPNHLLLGSSNGSKPPIAFSDEQMVLKHSYKMSQHYANLFWKRWVAEYLPTLTRRTKWFTPAPPLEVGAIVVIVDNNLPRNCWPMGRVVGISRSEDGQVRRALVETAHSSYERPAVNIAVLNVDSEWSKSDQPDRDVLGGNVTPLGNSA